MQKGSVQWLLHDENDCFVIDEINSARYSLGFSKEPLIEQLMVTNTVKQGHLVTLKDTGKSEICAIMIINGGFYVWGVPMVAFNDDIQLV